jgi:glycosyltransferase involved in cell wall biosynthesis
MNGRCRIVVGLPTRGRAAILRETLSDLERQTRSADAIIVCGAEVSDLEGVAEDFPAVIRLTSKPGLTTQRNAIIDAATDADILVFFDDDFLPDPAYLANVERHMTADPHLVVTTGRVLADGIGGPGLSPSEGRAIVAAAHEDIDEVKPTFSGYGCNMALRVAPMREHDIHLDDRLPLYGWQEDVDLSRRLAAFGDVVRLEGARGVHLGVKSGRGSGVKLGYSQVANPLYLAGKHAGYPMGRALEHIARNMAKNLARAGWPEPYVDRRGRLRGNLLALRDLLAGRMAPERVLEL